MYFLFQLFRDFLILLRRKCSSQVGKKQVLGWHRWEEVCVRLQHPEQERCTHSPSPCRRLQGCVLALDKRASCQCPFAGPPPRSLPMPWTGRGLLPGCSPHSPRPLVSSVGSSKLSVNCQWPLTRLAVPWCFSVTLFCMSEGRTHVATKESVN